MINLTKKYKYRIVLNLHNKFEVQFQRFLSWEWKKLAILETLMQAHECVRYNQRIDRGYLKILREY